MFIWFPYQTMTCWRIRILCYSHLCLQWPLLTPELLYWMLNEKHWCNLCGRHEACAMKYFLSHRQLLSLLLHIPPCWCIAIYVYMHTNMPKYTLLHCHQSCGHENFCSPFVDPKNQDLEKNKTYLKSRN